MGMQTRYQHQRRSRLHGLSTNSSGFTLIEIVTVLAIALIISGFAVLSTQGALKNARVNGAYDNAFTQLRMARERAIEERKRYIVTFGAPAPIGALTPLGAPNAKSIQLYRWDAPNAPPCPCPVPAPVQISTIDLPFDVAFQAIPGVPTSPATVPDGFGTGITAIDFDQSVTAFAGSANTVMFVPDGSAQDTLNNSNNGILYIARNGDLSSSRAITVFGTSGRVRGWRLTQAGGVAQWKQQ